MDDMTVGGYLLVALASFLASSGGFWIFLKKRRESKDATTRLLMGLGQDKILFLGMRYIERGWISSEEYDDLKTYLFDPYIELGGNGTAERVMRMVESLPFRSTGHALPVEYPRSPSEDC